MKLLFLVPYPHGKAPSQRFRYEQYLVFLEEEGIGYDIVPFFDEETWEVLYQNGRWGKKTFGIIKGYLRRLGQLFRVGKYDKVFIHREMVPMGWPVLEWLLTKVWKKPVIYDMDDAVWLPNSSRSNRHFKFLKSHANVRALCKWAHVVSCGNEHICEFARQYNDRVMLNPTTIDTEGYHNQVKEFGQHSQGKFVIGWTGAHSTLGYLRPLIPVIRELEKQYNIQLNVISDQPPEFDLDCLKFIRWSKETEIEDLLEFDVGVMPLTDDSWARGKCGFKALQYLALGIPALVSPVGVNTKIVEDGKNGFLCRTPVEWKEKLELLVQDPGRLKDLAARARKKVVEAYSVKSNKANFLRILRA